MLRNNEEIIVKLLLGSHSKIFKDFADNEMYIQRLEWFYFEIINKS